MKFSFTALAKITAKASPETNSSIMETVDIIIMSDDKILEKSFLDANGLPNKQGTKFQTIGFIQGLAANIHAAHKAGYWDSAQHLRYIISELEKAFVYADVDVIEGEWNEG